MMSCVDLLTGKRVLVTGGSGFLGGKVLERLSSRDAVEVSAPRSAEYDLREREAIREALGATRPDVIVHLAAVVGGIGANMESPGQFFYDNAIMGIQLIEEARLAGVERFVCLGTVCAYPKHGRRRSTRTSCGTAIRRRPTRRTASRRRCCSCSCRPTASSTGFDAIYLLPVNLYGPDDNFDVRTSHVIPALIKKCCEAVDSGAPSITCWGTGSASREFLYVDDAAAGIVAAIERYSGGEPVNLGSGRRSTIRRADRADRRARRIRGRDRLGLEQARRPAAALARHEPSRARVRLQGQHGAAGRSRGDDRVVPLERERARGSGRRRAASRLLATPANLGWPTYGDQGRHAHTIP